MDVSALAVVGALVALLTVSGAVGAQDAPAAEPPPGSVLDANTLSRQFAGGMQVGGMPNRDLSGPRTVNYSAAQTFTARNTGTVTAVEVEVSRASGESPLTARLLHLDASGAPDSAKVLGSASVPAANVAESQNQRIRFVFSNPPQVAAGARYALMLSTANDTHYGWSTFFEDPYAGGDPYLRMDDEPWTIYASGRQDTIFGVYVRPNAAPTIRPVSPAPGARTSDRTPTIRAVVRDDSGDLGAAQIRLSVDGKRKSFSYVAKERDQLTRTLTLAPGRHTVKVVATDRFGKTTATSWSFRITQR